MKKITRRLSLLTAVFLALALSLWLFFVCLFVCSLFRILRRRRQ